MSYVCCKMQNEFNTRLNCSYSISECRDFSVAPVDIFYFCHSYKRRCTVPYFLPYYCTFNFTATPLTLIQGRILGSSELDILPVVGIATVEIIGLPHERPTYYFDCISNQNNGSGLRWTRLNGPQRFRVDTIHSGLPGIRMSSGGIGSSDLGVYRCTDDYSNDAASLNITDSKRDSFVKVVSFN